jgi:hypothetical protein
MRLDVLDRDLRQVEIAEPSAVDLKLVPAPGHVAPNSPGVGLATRVDVVDQRLLVAQSAGVVLPPLQISLQLPR